jgi:aspartyl-tRNA(Asn)/glutamyl-tRNA(Gln) amidotransferase subunit B
MLQRGMVTGKTAKSVADDMVATPGMSPMTIVENNPSYRPFANSQELGVIVQEVVRENGQSVIDFRAGKDRAFSFLVGQVMKRTKGSASPEEVHRLLNEAIANIQDV